MKKILGLDLGTTSIGWALVNEAESSKEKSSIIKTGVRLVPLDNFTNSEGKDIKMKISDAFASGMGVSTRAARRSAKSARVNGERFKMRRDSIIRILTENHWIDSETALCEDGKNTTHETLALRTKAVTEEITLAELARVLLMINKKRGYKSNRKLQSADEGEAVNGIELARTLYEQNITPGQYVYSLFQSGKRYAPQFYPSDLNAEFDRIWECQQKVYPVLTAELREQLRGKNEKATWAILAEPLGLVGLKRDGKKTDVKRENYQWRAEAVDGVIDKEKLAVVLSRINVDINGTSGYLGEISDRSKLLYFKKQTIGQYLYKLIKKNPHQSLKKKVFYREDYMDEFEAIWEKQKQFHPEALTDELKKQIRNECIFFQRPLKSQKGKVDFCTLESKQTKRLVDGKEVTVREGLRVCPKSSPLFQDFKVLQGINNLRILDKQTYEERPLTEEEHRAVYTELNLSDKMSKSAILKTIGLKASRYDLNYDELPGNTTRSALFKAFLKMFPVTGHTEIDEKKTNARGKEDAVLQLFAGLGFNVRVLDIDINIEGRDFDKQPAYKLWHILYSSEGKNLEEHITALCGFQDYPECSAILSKVTFGGDYGNLSAKALRKLLPFMRQGMNYYEACEAVGYQHSERSRTKEELETRELLDRLPTYKSGALRNPVVDKVLAQMTNVVNNIIEVYGRPDEVHVEMAREMKRSAKERQSMTKAINENKKNAERIRQLLKDEFHFAHPTTNDIVRWRLYEELECNGYKTLYSNTYIRREDVFSKLYDIEHIIPQARLFDDSFANKTLELTSVNQTKGASTTFDYMASVSNEAELEQYKARVNQAFVDGKISKTKRNNLLMKESEIPSDFIQRDLRETQYITRQAMAILEEVVRTVIATSGSITDRLREEWQLIDIMKEINIPVYDKLGLVRRDTNHDGQTVCRIENWTKRSDNRHHAMDALTVAFTTRSHIQYLNTLNANYNEGKKKQLDCPMAVKELRQVAKQSLEDILISMRTSKKVATTHRNKATGQTCITPRGKLHGETYYGSIERNGETVYTTRKAIAPDLDISAVIDNRVREILEARLAEYGGDANKAFTALDENPIWLNREAGISIKKVTIRAKKVNAPIAIHTKHDNQGKPILDKDGKPIPVDFVAPDSNHHIAFFKDQKGNLQERIMTFFEAVERKNQGESIIDTSYMQAEGWEFKFSLQRGDYVVFPSPDFNPQEIDLTNPANYKFVSPHLFVVQKLSKKDYWFRHHLDPTTDNNSALENVTWKRIRSASGLVNIVKVRLDSLGNIVEVNPVEL